jgi:ABC-type glutathione transport system ATPase component
MPSGVLAVRDLTVELISARKTAVPVVSGVSFQVEAGSIVGLFGESGCGKTTLALALLNLLPAPRYRVRGSVQLRDFEVLSASERQLERIRGAEISLIFQDPLLALNPVLRVRDQVREVMRAHGRQDGLESLFGLVGLAATRRMYDAYPHQLSGGERQRVVIAQALACRPALVIADEPFTALDATRVVELSSLFRELREKLQASFLLISHSPGVLARTADQVLIMQAGRIVERGTPRQVLGKGTAHGG